MLRLCLAFLAAIVGTTANVARRDVSCEKLMAPILDDPNQFCSQLRETYSNVRYAIKDVEQMISDSSKESVEDFSGILESTVRYLNENLPSYLPVRITRDAERREAQADDFSAFHKLVADAGDAAVAADLAASEQIRRAILEAVSKLHQGEDLISQGAQKILKNMLQKRSAEVDLQQTLAALDDRLKFEMTGALKVCLKEFRRLVRDMLQKLKNLLAGKVQVDFDSNKEAIDKLSDEALVRVGESYDTSTKKIVNEAVIKTHDHLTEVRKIALKNPEAIHVMGQVVLALSGEASVPEGGGIKYADVREAFNKAAQSMEDQYKNIAALVGK